MFLSKKLMTLSLMGLMLVGLSGVSARTISPLYSEGELLSLENGTAIYYIGPDAKKYVFPEAKTYATWYDNFSNVREVNLEELDKYEDGGTMPVRGGTQLITHANTAKIYAVEPGGLARHIPNAKTAENLFGANWYTNVMDVLPGYFSTSYKFGEPLSETLPNGYLVAEEGDDDYYYMENGKKRLLSTSAFEENRFREKFVYRIKNVNKYANSTEIVEAKKSLTNFIPFLDDVNDKKVLICHYPNGNNDNARTLSVSVNSIPVHLKNGSTLGECSEEKDDIEEPLSTPDVDDWGVDDLEPGQWCSVLMGMFNSVELGYTDSSHAVLDLDGSGEVSLTDLGLLTDMYANEENGACYDQIVSNYEASNYEEVDWCNGLVQGITDTYSDEIVFSVFDLNDDQVLNLSDVSLVASYLYEADQAACYLEYVPILASMEIIADVDDLIVEVDGEPGTDDEDDNDLESVEWCSVLMGMFSSVELGYTDSSHAVLDLDGSGEVSLTDLSLLTDMYNNGHDGACYDQILSNYDSSNYEEVDWCNGLVRGITDTYSNDSVTSIFDLNDDQVLNLSDVGLVASYNSEADQAACYLEYIPTLSSMTGISS